MLSRIGETAGKIWSVLVEENGAMSVGQLGKKTKLPKDWLCMGIGWLAREDKLRFSGTPDIFEVSLK